MCVILAKEVNIAMPIPESTLEQWAAAVPPGQSSHTYDVIKTVFELHRWPAEMTHDVYLQGSYRNDTNIRQDSDIDVVMELTSAFYLDNIALPERSRAAHSRSFPAATHDLDDFYKETLTLLRSRFGIIGCIQATRQCVLMPATAYYRPTLSSVRLIASTHPQLSMRRE